MKKGILTLILFSTFINFTIGQIQIEFSSSSNPSPGGTYSLDVGVSNYNDILSTQYWIMWDSTVLAYDTIINITSDLPGFDMSVFGTPVNTTNGDGILGISWYDPDVQAPYGILPDGSPLFTIEFDVVGEECDSTAFTVEDLSMVQPIEIQDSLENELGLTFDPLPVKIPGLDCTDVMDPDTCGIVNEDASTGIIAGEVCAGPGEVACVLLQQLDLVI